MEGLSTEDLLKNLSIEDRLKGISADDLLEYILSYYKKKGLSRVETWTVLLNSLELGPEGKKIVSDILDDLRQSEE